MSVLLWLQLSWEWRLFSERYKYLVTSPLHSALWLWSIVVQWSSASAHTASDCCPSITCSFPFASLESSCCLLISSLTFLTFSWIQSWKQILAVCYRLLCRHLLVVYPEEFFPRSCSHYGFYVFLTSMMSIILLFSLLFWTQNNTAFFGTHYFLCSFSNF